MGQVYFCLLVLPYKQTIKNSIPAQEHVHSSLEQLVFSVVPSQYSIILISQTSSNMLF